MVLVNKVKISVRTRDDIKIQLLHTIEIKRPYPVQRSYLIDEPRTSDLLLRFFLSLCKDRPSSSQGQATSLC